MSVFVRKGAFKDAVVFPGGRPGDIYNTRVLREDHGKYRVVFQFALPDGTYAEACGVAADKTLAARRAYAEYRRIKGLPAEDKRRRMVRDVRLRNPRTIKRNDVLRTASGNNLRVLEVKPDNGVGVELIVRRYDGITGEVIADRVTVFVPYGYCVSFWRQRGRAFYADK